MWVGTASRPIVSCPAAYDSRLEPADCYGNAGNWMVEARAHVWSPLYPCQAAKWTSTQSGMRINSMACSPSLACAPEDQAAHVAHHRRSPCRWDMSALPRHQAVMVKTAPPPTTAPFLRKVPPPLLRTAPLLRKEPPLCSHTHLSALVALHIDADLRASELSLLACRRRRRRYCRLCAAVCAPSAGGLAGGLEAS